MRQRVRGSRRRRLLLFWVAVLFVFLAALSVLRMGPLVVADEFGYLINLAPFYRGGYYLLLTPLFELGSSQIFAYHLVIVLNAALAASVIPLGRLPGAFGLRPRRPRGAAASAGVWRGR